MKLKLKIAVCCLAVAALCAMTGCQLALEEGDPVNAYDDRLVGVLVTTEHLDLFDFEGYIEDNLGTLSSGGELALDGNGEKYQGRLYATLTDKTLTDEYTGEQHQTQEYVFEGVEGMAYFAVQMMSPGGSHSGDSPTLATSSDEAISDGRVDLKYVDNDVATILEGTIYVAPSDYVGPFFFNPVYQSSDGSVYAVTGSGSSSSGVMSEGTAYTQSMEATTTVTEKLSTFSYSASVTMTVAIKYPTTGVAVLQLDTGGVLVARDEYAPGSLPETLCVAADTAYLVVETHKTDGEGNAIVQRELIDTASTSIETFFCREDGVFIKEYVQLQWPDTVGAGPGQTPY